MKTKLIHPITGEVREFVLIGPKAFYPSELKKNGTPDARKQAKPLGVRKRTGADGTALFHYAVGWAEIDISREQRASAIRAHRAALLEQAYDAERELLRLYSSEEKD